MAASLSNPSATRLRRLAAASLAVAGAMALGGLLGFPDRLHLALGATGATLATLLAVALRNLARQAIALQERSDRIAHRSEAILQARMRLITDSAHLDLQEFLVLTLDEVERFTASRIAFYHFLDPDQATLHLQAWSTRTSREYCHASGSGEHYALPKAGVWADCVRLRRPVIHNDYATLAEKKGLPDGHAGLVRELVVPIFRQEKIVAILGVGNKETPYDQDDVEMVATFADLAWELAERRITETELDTYRKRLEDMVQELELKYSTLFDGGSDAIFVTEIQDGGQNLRLVESNAVACRWLGYTRAEILRLDPLDLCPVQDRTTLEKSLREPGLHQGSRLETTLLGSSGEAIAVEISARPLEWQGRRWTLSIARDITERKRSEGELRDAISRAESASRVKSEFLANMSHEIRTPLNAVIGFSELLAGSDCRPEQSGYISSIRSSSRNLLRLINEILDMSKMEAGRMRIAAAPTDLRHLLEELVRMFGIQVGEKGVDLHLEIADDFPRMVLSDETRLRQILVNLVGNAVKFTNRGKVMVHAHSQPTSGMDDKVDVSFSVTDTGIGIDPEERELVFEAFEQSHRNLASAGTGLGLAISRKLARLMGGDILLESLPGMGSTFTLRLPGLEAIPADSSVDIPSEDLATVRFEGGRVLVVDDLDVNRTLMWEILHLAGLECIEAENGEIAILLANQSRPDLILMDLRMPVMDGWEATRRLRAEESTRNIPIVALTASIDRRKSPDLEGHGFDGFLGKPVEIHHLVRTLDRWFVRRKADSLPETEQAPIREAPDRVSIDAIRPALDAFREKSASGLNFGDVRILSNSIAQAAKDSASPGLADIAERLAQAAKSFDLRAIERILEQLGRNA